MSTREEPDGDADRSPRAEAPAADAGRADEASAAHETAPAPAAEGSAATAAATPATEATAEPVAEPDGTDPTPPEPSADADEAGGSPSSDDGPGTNAPGDANDPVDANAPEGSGPEADEPDDPMTAEEIAVDRSRVRRAPRYGRFIGIGVALGLLISLAQTVGAEPEDIAAASGPWTSTTVGFFLVMATIFVPVGVLLGALTALVLDRRSRRPRRKGR